MYCKQSKCTLQQDVQAETFWGSAFQSEMPSQGWSRACQDSWEGASSGGCSGSSFCPLVARIMYEATSLESISACNANLICLCLRVLSSYPVRVRVYCTLHKWAHLQSTSMIHTNTYSYEYNRTEHCRTRSWFRARLGRVQSSNCKFTVHCTVYM